MSITAEFKRAIIRRLAYLSVAFLFGWLAAIGNADAHTRPCQLNAEGKATCDQGQASEEANRLQNAINHCRNYYSTSPPESITATVNNVVHNDIPNSGNYEQNFSCKNAATGSVYFSDREYYNYKGSCSERNASLGGTGQSDRSLGFGKGEADQCLAGCKYKLVSDRRVETAHFSLSGGQPTTHTKIWGKWEYTGDICGTPQNPPSQNDPRDDEGKSKDPCTPPNNGHSYCSLPDGTVCNSAGAGRTICWGPSENGSKTDGPVTQTKAPGNAPPGNVDGSSHTSTTNVTNVTNNSSTNTTINNFTTNNGSPAGSGNSGNNTNPDGSPKGNTGGGNSGGNENGNESSGGVNCESAPTSTGDAILGNILVQTWNTRCEIVKSRGKLEGSPQCNQGGVVGFACSGDQALCFNALKAQEAKCKAEYDDAINADQAAQIAGQGDGLDGVNVSDIYGPGEDETGQINEGLLGGSTGQCEFAAPLEIAGQSIEIPSGLWQLLGMIQMLLTASAYLWVASQLSR